VIAGLRDPEAAAGCGGIVVGMEKREPWQRSASEMTATGSSRPSTRRCTGADDDTAAAATLDEVLRASRAADTNASRRNVLIGGGIALIYVGCLFYERSSPRDGSDRS
jgi:hypothetical protein